MVRSRKVTEVPAFFSIHSTAEVDLANRFILEQGLAPTPACWLILIGYQYDDATDRLATYLAHPKAMLTELIQVVDRIREIDPDGFITVCAAGRAGHYLATAGMLLGLHVRVGTEDTVYRFPHRDELVEGNGEMVERVVATAKALGRTPATPEQYRQMGCPPAPPDTWNEGVLRWQTSTRARRPACTSTPAMGSQGAWPSRSGPSRCSSTRRPRGLTPRGGSRSTPWRRRTPTIRSRSRPSWRRRGPARC
jgi:hypothetical protein